MANKGGKRPGAGRPAGSKNKSTLDVQAFVDRVFSNIDPIEKLTTLLSSESEKVQAGVMLRLLEYRYGKPKETLEVSGNIDLRTELAEARKRAGID